MQYRYVASVLCMATMAGAMELGGPLHRVASDATMQKSPRTVASLHVAGGHRRTHSSQLAVAQQLVRVPTPNRDVERVPTPNPDVESQREIEQRDPYARAIGLTCIVCGGAGLLYWHFGIGGGPLY